MNGLTPSLDSVYRSNSHLDSLTFSTINNLIRNNEIPWPDLLLQAADGAKGNDCPYSQASQSCNVCSARHLMWSMFMVQAVSREERDRSLIMLENGNWRGRGAPRRCGGDSRNWSISSKLLKTSTANYGDTDDTWNMLESE